MSVADVFEKAKRVLLRIDGVVGVSVRDGRLVVFVESEEDVYKVPRVFEGVPVDVVVVGRVRLLEE